MERGPGPQATPASVFGGAVAAKTPPDEALARLASYVKLTVDWREDRRTFVDNFVPFAVDAARGSDTADITVEGLRGAIAEQHRLDLPVHVVRTLLQRGTLLGVFANLGSGTWRVAPETVFSGESGGTGAVARYEREQLDLANRLREFLAANYAIDVSQDTALGDLHDFVDRNFGALMSIWGGRGPTPLSPAGLPGDRILRTAAFVYELSRTDAARFDFVVNMAKGKMLVAALFTPSNGPSIGSFRDTSLFFDTRIVLEALGYQGPEHADNARQFLDAAASQGAGLRVFEVTFREIQRVLFRAEQSAKDGTLWTWQPGSVGSHFLNAPDPMLAVNAAASYLEDDLEDIGIIVEAMPSYSNHRHVVDERSVGEYLRSRVPGYGDAALDHDVSALSAIVRLREGKARRSLEQCRALFVTSNSLILHTAKKIEDLKAEPWPVAMVDTDVATLLWVKSPEGLPDTPSQALATTCLRLLSPTEKRWQRYVLAFTERHQVGDITDAELMTSRAMFEISRVSALAAVDSPPSVVGAQVDATIEQARAEAVREAKKQIEAEGSELAGRLHAAAKSHSAEIAALDARHQNELAELQASIDDQIRVAVAEAADRAEAARRARVRGRIARVSSHVIVWTAVAAIGILAYVGLGFLKDPAPPLLWVGRVVVVVLAVTGGVILHALRAANWLEHYILRALRVVEDGAREE